MKHSHGLTRARTERALDAERQLGDCYERGTGVDRDYAESFKWYQRAAEQKHPVGVGSLAVAVGEEPDTLEEVYEPYLIMEGYLKRTPQGRVATELSYKKLGLKIGGSKQPGLL